MLIQHFEKWLLLCENRKHFSKFHREMWCCSHTHRTFYMESVCAKCSIVMCQTSCSLMHTFQSYGYNPLELMVEDFPKSRISLSYSDGSYTYKRPHSVGRQKRQILLNSTVPLNITHTIGNTANLPNATTAYPTTTAAPRIYRTTIPPLGRLPLQFSIYGLLLSV